MYFEASVHFAESRPVTQWTCRSRMVGCTCDLHCFSVHRYRKTVMRLQSLIDTLHVVYSVCTAISSVADFSALSLQLHYEFKLILSVLSVGLYI